jgi:hypothetical protein
MFDLEQNHIDNQTKIIGQPGLSVDDTGCSAGDHAGALSRRAESDSQSVAYEVACGSRRRRGTGVLRRYAKAT